MTILIKNATLVCPENKKQHLTKQDLLIENGKIVKIGKSVKSNNATVISSKNLHVSVGWMDLRADFCDPGFEHKETVQSGLNAAAAGGFTAVAVLPNTLPAIDNKSAVEYLIKNSKNHLVDLVPYGAISQKIEGTHLAEMYDMTLAGAAGFTDGKKPIQDANLMMRALLYAKGIGKTIFNFPHATSIARDGMMNEGINSTLLGLKPLPALAEDLMVNRDLFLLEYTQGSLHIGPISTEKSVQLIKDAKKKGLKVTASVALANLIFDDGKLTDFDSNYKVLPPLRTATEIKALIRGLKEGVIDAISTNHIPQNIENKDVEFDFASFGITMLETFYSLYNTYLQKDISLELFVALITKNPRQILGIAIPEIQENTVANLTLFDPELEFFYQEKNKKSVSANSPVIGQKLKGKVVATINGNKMYLSD